MFVVMVTSHIASLKKIIYLMIHNSMFTPLPN